MIQPSFHPANVPVHLDGRMGFVLPLHPVLLLNEYFRAIAVAAGIIHVEVEHETEHPGVRRVDDGGRGFVEVGGGRAACGCLRAVDAGASIGGARRNRRRGESDRGDGCQWSQQGKPGDVLLKLESTS